MKKVQVFAWRSPKQSISNVFYYAETVQIPVHYAPGLLQENRYLTRYFAKFALKFVLPVLRNATDIQIMNPAGRALFHAENAQRSV